MASGVLIWYGNELGLGIDQMRTFPKEYADASRLREEYRYLFNMVKETKGPQETFRSLIPNFTLSPRVQEDQKEEYLRQLDRRLDRSCQALLQQAVLDSN